MGGYPAGFMLWPLSYSSCNPLSGQSRAGTAHVIFVLLPGAMKNHGCSHFLRSDFDRSRRTSPWARWFDLPASSSLAVVVQVACAPTGTMRSTGKWRSYPHTFEWLLFFDLASCLRRGAWSTSLHNCRKCHLFVHNVGRHTYPAPRGTCYFGQFLLGQFQAIYDFGQRHIFTKKKIEVKSHLDQNCSDQCSRPLSHHLEPDHPPWDPSLPGTPLPRTSC